MKKNYEKKEIHPKNDKIKGCDKKSKMYRGKNKLAIFIHTLHYY